MKPILFPSALQHRNFVDARQKLFELVRCSPGGKTIALVGPTQAGKSLIFEQLIKELEQSLRPSDPSMMPFIYLEVATSQDGRISGKHVTFKLLKAVRHPLYDRVGELDEFDHYRPSRNRDEGSMRVAAEAALTARQTIFLLMDEAQHLTHTKNETLRANILQSIKCLGAINRTLVLSGGYELAYRGLFDSAHFAGRLVCVEFRPYTSASDDMCEWEKILKFASKYVAVTPSTLLLDEAEALLFASNGSFGLLEKILWVARALNLGKEINRSQLYAAFPLRAEREAIQADIREGQRALARMNFCAHSAPSNSPQKKKKGTSRPFQRKPNRKQPPYPEMGDE
jgi:hypothetical protein